MSETKVNLGFLPVNRGTYSNSATYYKDNIVQYNGSSYICTQDPGSGATPQGITGEVPYVSQPDVPNTHWAVFANNQGGPVEGIYDISANHATDNIPKAYDSLSAALADVPTAKKTGGLVVKFIQITPATYNVVKTEGVTELPTGTLLDSASSIGSGTYTASQLSDFSTLPTTSAVTYYVAVTEDETTTYTTWVITLAQSSDNKYVQYRLTSNSFSTKEIDWQESNFSPLLRKTQVLGSYIPEWIYGKYIVAADLTKVDSDLWCYSEPIQVKQGDVISVNTAGVGVSFITKSDSQGNLINSIVSSYSYASTTKLALYTHTMQEDTYIVLCYKYSIAGAFFEINGIRNDVNVLSNKLIKLTGIGSSGAEGGITAEGQIYYNTISKKLRKCVNYNLPFSSEDFVDVPFYDGAIYIYNNVLYIWNGTDLDLSRTFLKNAYRESASPWEASHSYSVNDKVEYDNCIWKCVTAHTSTASFNYSAFIFADNAGIDQNEGIMVSGGCKILKLVGFGTMGGGTSGVQKIGDVFYNTANNKLWLCTSFTSSANFTSIVIPYFDGAIYTYNNELYRWDGTALVKIIEVTPEVIRTGKMPIDVEAHIGIINTSGEIVVTSADAAYRYTSPIKVYEGEKIVVQSSKGGYAAISETDASGTYYNCLVPSQLGGINVKYEYTAPQEMYVAFSYRDEGHELYSVIGSSIDEEEIENIMYEKGVVINSITQVQSSAQSGGANVITFTLANGNTYNVTIYNGQQGPQGDTVILGNEDTYTLYNSLGNNTDGAITQKVVTEKLAEISHQNDFFGGIYAYDFRTIADTDIWIYKDALFTGLKPVDNYEVFVPNSDSAFIKNYSKRALKFNSAAGNRTLHLQVRDIYNTVKFYKNISVVVRNQPLQKLSNEDHLNVFFFGDSIIGQNYNAIGAEFYRYLSTSNAGETSSDGSIKPRAINICNSKLRLVGEMVHSGTNYQYLFQVASVLTGKRDIPYGDSAGNSKTYWMEHNPFYNPDSTEPDEIGADGFNKRVDFQWYFENACGVGKYPELIYMSIGANDIGTYDNYWSGDSINVTAERLIAVCKKMKAACDVIAGGESGSKIKIFNHQSYPLYFAAYNNLPIEQARCVQNRYYNQVLAEIASENVGSYVELIDCASKFDIVNGYNVGAINTNSRTTAVNDSGLLSGDGVHMNTVGAYQYADSLIRDFIADSDFD